MSRISKIIELMSKNKRALGLVSMMSPVELMKALVGGLDLLPKEAASVVYGLVKKNEGLSGPSIETNKMYPVPSQLRGARDEDDPLDELSLRIGPQDFSKGQFPPDPIAEPDNFPYDSTFVNYMNNPKRKKPIVSGRERENDGEGSGIYQKNYQSKDGDMPGQGSGWSIHGRKGWSSALGQFDIPPKSIKKAEPVEQNAGDTNDGTSFMNEPNVGQTIWVPGRQGVRSAPYRAYRKR